MSFRNMAAATSNLTAPEPVSFQAKYWTAWSRRFRKFRICSGLSTQEEEVQISTLIYLMGDWANDIYESFRLSDEEKKKFETIFKCFDSYFSAKKNIIFERVRFNKRSQEEGEPVEEFIEDLYRLAKTCNYGQFEEELIRDRLVVGLRDMHLSETLQLDTDLTLEKAIRKVRLAEEVKKQQNEIRCCNVRQDCNCEGETCKQDEMSSLYERRPSKPRAIKINSSIDRKSSIDCYYSAGFEPDDEVFIEFEEWQSNSSSCSFSKKHIMAEGSGIRRQRRTSDVIDSLGDFSPENIPTRARSCTSPDLRETVHNFDSASPLTPRSDIGYWSSSTSIPSPFEPKWFRFSQSSDSRNSINRQGPVRPSCSDTNCDRENAGSSDSCCLRDVDSAAQDEVRLTCSTTIYQEKSSVPVKRADTTDAIPNQPPTSPEVMRCFVKETLAPVERDSTEYNMCHKKRGFAVIFNHEEYRCANLPPREGSKHDVVALETLYTMLGFKVIVHNNLRCRELYDILHELAQMDHTDHDCLIVTVLTHGIDGGTLYAFDAPYPCEDLYNGFLASNCLSLAGKPKIFIIQACRGKKLDRGVRLLSRTATDSSVTSSYTIPNMADFLIANSTYGGHFSWRNPDEGTWFIQSLVKVISDQYKEVDLLTMLTRVAWAVSILYESVEDDIPEFNGLKQSPSLVSTLLRQVYFRPKK